MFASGRTDRVRAKQISQAVQTALGSSSQKTKLDGMQKADGQSPAPLDLESSMAVLRKELAPEIGDGKVQLRLESRGLIVGLSAASFFPSGADVIDPGSYHTIAKVATVLNTLPNALRLEGHTDSVPINTPRFKSNWELSAARSIAMLRLLNEQYGVDRNRMAVIGYADTESTADSDETEEQHRKHRRVDIVIMSDTGMRAEPQSR
jgi:chemotaxis protein MotB